MLVRACTTRSACFFLALPVICTLLVLCKVWYGQDSGRIQAGFRRETGFVTRASTRKKWPSAREWLARGATGPVPRCNAGQP